jgi:hypothetical protein
MTECDGCGFWELPACLESVSPTRRRSVRSRLRLLAYAAGLALAAVPAQVGATSFPVTTEVQDFLIIGTGPGNASPTVDVGHAANTNNFELGANKAPVPATSDFLTGGGGGGGPGLAGNVPDLPSGILAVGQGISGDGNVAITDMTGAFNLQDVGVYADPAIGIRCANTESACNDGSQNSFFNDPNQFPNTFVPVADPTMGTGDKVNPNEADPTTSIGDDWGPGGVGVTGNIDFSVLEGELANLAAAIPTLTGTGTLDVSGTGGKIESDTTFLLSPGVNIIDVVTGGGVDFLIQNSNFVIDGPVGAFALFRLPDDANMLISQANVLVGDGGIGLNAVTFYTDQENANQHFNFNNTVINGVAFWDLGPFVDPIMNFGGEININNAQGCTQLIADKVTLNDVRFTRCAAVVPEPGTFGLTALGLLGLSLLAAGRRGRLARSSLPS